MKLSPAQKAALQLLARGQDAHQVRVSSVSDAHPLRVRATGWRHDTIRALVDAGAITTTVRHERETTQGVSTRYTLIDARLTDKGRALATEGAR